MDPVNDSSQSSLVSSIFIKGFNVIYVVTAVCIIVIFSIDAITDVKATKMLRNSLEALRGLRSTGQAFEQVR